MIGISLFDSLKTLPQSYYYIYIEPSKLFDAQHPQAQEKCHSFIKQHFDNGRKGEAFSFPWKEEYKNNGKHVHTVSLYLMGLLFQEQLRQILEEKLRTVIPTIGQWFDYRYTWFLTCLFHDAASCIEQHTIDANTSMSKKQLSFYVGDLDIQYTTFSHTPQNIGGSLTRFSESLIQNYFYYRAEWASFEHGIIGGYYLFDRLKKNFCTATANHDWQQNSTYIKDGLNWRLEHLDHFAYICDAIICHNLWTVESTKPNDSSKYKAYGLTPLIVDGIKGKLEFAKYPLQFLLCLLDSIEPVKRFSRISANEVLHQVSILLQKNGANEFVLKVSWNEALQKQDGYDQWKESISALKRWMDVEKKGKFEDCSIEICFPISAL